MGSASSSKLPEKRYHHCSIAERVALYPMHYLLPREKPTRMPKTWSASTNPPQEGRILRQLEQCMPSLAPAGLSFPCPNFSVRDRMLTWHPSLLLETLSFSRALL